MNGSVGARCHAADVERAGLHGAEQQKAEGDGAVAAPLFVDQVRLTLGIEHGVLWQRVQPLAGHLLGGVEAAASGQAQAMVDEVHIGLQGAGQVGQAPGAVQDGGADGAGQRGPGDVVMCFVQMQLVVQTAFADRGGRGGVEAVVTHLHGIAHGFEGGELAPAFALIDVMKISKIPIKTVGLGQIASCGLLIFLSGTPGRRVLTPNTSILSHQFSWGNEGKAHELFATVKEFELVQQRMVNLYKETTGLDEKTIKTVLLPAQDVYLSAQEALEYNICDAIG